MKNNLEEKKSDIPSSDPLGSQKFSLVVIILAIYILFIGFMLFSLFRLELNDLKWTRMLYLFTGIEAIVFAALGYAFGKDIHRKRAENAEKNVEQSKLEEEKAIKVAEHAKEQAQKEKEKGIQLSTAVFMKHSKMKDNRFVESAEFTTKDDIGNNGDNYLYALARQLYPTVDDAITVNFDYEISPVDKIKGLIINGEKKTLPTGTCIGVPIYQNRFTIDVDRENSFVEWTFKITRIIDSDHNIRKQLNGQLISDRPSDYVYLENE